MVRSQKSSPLNFSLDVGIELFPGDGLGIVAANCVNDLPELVFIVAVFQLFVDVFKVSDVELAFSLNVQQGEVGLSSLLAEWAALNQIKFTILVVSSLRNPSKSRALPPV